MTGSHTTKQRKTPLQSFLLFNIHTCEAKGKEQPSAAINTVWLRCVCENLSLSSGEKKTGYVLLGVHRNVSLLFFQVPPVADAFSWLVTMFPVAYTETFLSPGWVQVRIHGSQRYRKIALWLSWNQKASPVSCIATSFPLLPISLM